jgi:hypothetical protein
MPTSYTGDDAPLTTLYVVRWRTGLSHTVWASEDLAWQWLAYLDRSRSEPFECAAMDPDGQRVIIASHDVIDLSEAVSSPDLARASKISTSSPGGTCGH